MKGRVLRKRQKRELLGGERMVTMIVRGIPETLRREVKVAAAREGKTMSNFISEALQAAVQHSGKKGGR